MGHKSLSQTIAATLSQTIAATLSQTIADFCSTVVVWCQLLIMFKSLREPQYLVPYSITH